MFVFIHIDDIGSFIYINPETQKILRFGCSKGNCKGKNGFKVCYMEKSRILQLYCFVQYLWYFAIIMRE